MGKHVKTSSNQNIVRTVIIWSAVFIAAAAVIFFLLLKAGFITVRTPVSDKNTSDETVCDDPEEILGVPLTESIIPTTALGRTNELREIKYVVIHETGNFNTAANAAAHSELLTYSRSGTNTSWHYTVDCDEIYHHIPDNEIAWHAGDQRQENGGNMCGIGVELCVNEDGNFEKTFDNGAKLAAYLLRKHSLDISSLKQHFDFSGKNCPQTIRETGRWEEFMSLVQSYMDELSETEQDR